MILIGFAAAVLTFGAGFVRLAVGVFAFVFAVLFCVVAFTLGFLLTDRAGFFAFAFAVIGLRAISQPLQPYFFFFVSGSSIWVEMPSLTSRARRP